MAERCQGERLLSAAAIGLHSLHSDFLELGDEERDQARVAEDALHHALGEHVRMLMRGGGKLAGAEPAVAIAMSGGVDSAVALHEMYERHAGNVVGVTLRLWIDPQAPDPEAACCSPDSVRRARAACHALGVPHVSLDLRGAFAREVVKPFIEEYQSGKTPNPCVRCNGFFRLDELVLFADVVGARRVATGHYVRIVQRGERRLLQRGADPLKDQSYMLSTLAPRTLARLEFPLGAMTKVQTRARAGELGLEAASAPESQEVCFLGGGDYREFLQRAGALGPAGTIRTADGTALGSHDGIAQFTPGQRRGLRLNAPISGASPLYVLRTDAATGDVVVGDRRETHAHKLRLAEMTWHTDPPDSAFVQTRYRGGAQWAEVVAAADNRLDLNFLEPVQAPAPGQTACLYDEQGVVLGAGTISVGSM